MFWRYKQNGDWISMKWNISTKWNAGMHPLPSPHLPKLEGVACHGNLLNEVYLLSKFDGSSFSTTGDIEIFKLVILLTLSSSKLIVILLTLNKLKLTVIIYFYWLWAGQLFQGCLSFFFSEILGVLGEFRRKINLFLGEI